MAIIRQSERNNIEVFSNFINFFKDREISKSSFLMVWSHVFHDILSLYLCSFFAFVNKVSKSLWRGFSRKTNSHSFPGERRDSEDFWRQSRSHRRRVSTREPPTNQTFYKPALLFFKSFKLWLQCKRITCFQPISTRFMSRLLLWWEASVFHPKK